MWNKRRAERAVYTGEEKGEASQGFCLAGQRKRYFIALFFFFFEWPARLSLWGRPRPDGSNGL